MDIQNADGRMWLSLWLELVVSPTCLRGWKDVCHRLQRVIYAPTKINHQYFTYLINFSSHNIRPFQAHANVMYFTISKGLNEVPKCHLIYSSIFQNQFSVLLLSAPCGAIHYSATFFHFWPLYHDIVKVEIGD